MLFRKVSMFGRRDFGKTEAIYTHLLDFRQLFGPAVTRVRRRRRGGRRPGIRHRQVEHVPLALGRVRVARRPTSSVQSLSSSLLGGVYSVGESVIVDITAVGAGVSSALAPAWSPRRAAITSNRLCAILITASHRLCCKRHIRLDEIG